MNSPLVSVICTSYNHGKFIQDALDSVINQTWGSIELVIIDNGSSDGSAGRVEEWILEMEKTAFPERVAEDAKADEAAAEAAGEIDAEGEPVESGSDAGGRTAAS